ncbi:MAG: amphi-Trp domain-containing protein [Nannocystaceae bacterium]
MSDRDVERECTREQFVEALRRAADAIERGESFRIQVQQKRFTVPVNAQFAIEHEVDGRDEELEFQLKWRRLI